MLSALLNIAGGLGMLAFLVLMTRCGSWARQGFNRALAAALMLASVATVMLATSLEQYGARARHLAWFAYAAYGVAGAALLLWMLKRQPPPR